MEKERIIVGGWGEAVKTIKYQMVPGTWDKGPDTLRVLRDFRNLIKSRRRYAPLRTNNITARVKSINCGTVHLHICKSDIRDRLKARKPALVISLDTCSHATRGVM